MNFRDYVETYVPILDQIDSAIDQELSSGGEITERLYWLKDARRWIRSARTLENKYRHAPDYKTFFNRAKTLRKKGIAIAIKWL